MNVIDIGLADLKQKMAEAYFPKEVRKRLLECDISWNNRFRGATAGVAKFRKENGSEYRSIEISSKYIKQYPDQLKSIMLHEMIHIVLEIGENHGKNFKIEMNRINKQLELEGDHSRVSVRISEDKRLPRDYKYTYFCRKCGQIYNRVRKPIDLKRNVCGRCYGKLVSSKINEKIGSHK